MAWILLLLAGSGQEYPVMPILDIPDWTCHRRKKRERKGEGKMLGCHLIWLKENLQAVRENLADDGHCKIRGIRKVHRIITKPNKPNGVKAYSGSLLHAITAHNHLPFFKIFSNFVHFCPNFQIFSLFSNISLLFFWKITTHFLYILE